MINLKRILVPTDFSDTSLGALEYAKTLASAFHASLHVLHVLESPFPGWMPENPIGAVATIRADMERDADERLGKLLSDAERTQFTATTEKRWGNAFAEIVRVAEEQPIDMIVLGTHGRGAIAHALLGSVAEKIVRKASCPVLTVRAKS